MSKENRTYNDPYTIRLPEGWRDAIKVRAARNRRSMNQEVLAALESVVKAEQEVSHAAKP